MENENKLLASGMLSHKEEYLKTLKTYIGSQFNDGSYHGAALALLSIKHLKYNQIKVNEALKRAVEQTTNIDPKTITNKFVAIYPLLEIEDDYEAQIESALKELEAGSENKIWYQYSTFCAHTLPLSKTDEKEISTEYPNNKLTISAIGNQSLPYGGIPRLIILYINTIAVKYGTDKIKLGKNLKEFVEALGYRASYIEGGTNEQVLNQLDRLFKTEFSHETSKKTFNESGQLEINTKQVTFKIFDEKESFETLKGGFTEKTEVFVRLSNTYYKEIKAHPVPLSLETIKKLKKSPLALDLYAFISYRANTRKIIPIKLEDLMKQFGIKEELWRFRPKAEKALDSLKKFWPECNVVIKKQAMIILPTKTQIV